MTRSCLRISRNQKSKIKNMLLLPSKLDSDSRLSKHFLPHQVAWIQAEKAVHEQRKQVVALAEKSVRIGWTYADAFKNVRKRILNRRRDYLFATKDYESALDYIRLCRRVAELFDYARTIISHGEEYLKVPRVDGQGRPTAFTDEIKVGCIKFDNGSHIRAFSSSPQAMAVYGGDVGLDEYAKHPQAELLWETVQGRITWNFDFAAWSAHDGENTYFNELVREARAGKGPCNLYYRVTLEDALDFGLLDIINQVRGTTLSRAQFISDCRTRFRREELFQQACMCNPLGDASATIAPWSAIERCRSDYPIERLHLEAAEVTGNFGEFNPDDADARRDRIENFLRSHFRRLLQNQGRIRLGFDVAASGQGDLAAFYFDEARGNELWLTGLLTCRTDDWDFLETVLHFFLRSIRSVSATGDETGLGQQICWGAARAFGGRFSPVNFRTKKHDLGFLLMNQLASAEKRFPRAHNDIAADYFALRKNFVGKRWVFSEGTNQFNPNSHCDIAWAGALASEAHALNRNVLTARLG